MFKSPLHIIFIERLKLENIQNACLLDLVDKDKSLTHKVIEIQSLPIIIILKKIIVYN